VDPDDVPRVLKTIEDFAIECSINKVWSSEALAYAVDESLQVYGGNGYSREFPAERAYRDARITRIYEGTNEINRLIVGTRLARSAVVAPVIAEQAARGAGAQAGTAAPGSALAAERDLLARAKQVTAFALGRAAAAYGKGLGGEQEVVGRLADMAIEVYALESAILRTEKMIAAGAGHAPTATEITRVFAADASDRLQQAAGNALAGIDAPDTAAVVRQARAALAHAPTNTIAARRRIADAVTEANRYPL
jgi:alkylation response protein AidB-like acyl-CoA dehydrogenase